MQPAKIKERLTSFGGQFSVFIPTGASTSTIKRGIGRLCRIVVTTAGTAAFTVFDNTAASGNVLFASPATTSLGTVFDLSAPAQNGITIVNVASGPALAVSFN
jgi:hypothetical protein